MEINGESLGIGFFQGKGVTVFSLADISNIVNIH